MRIILFLLSLLWLAAVTAPAGSRSTQIEKESAIQCILSGTALQAFNFLQEENHRPEVTQMDYDEKTDRFFWKGPVTGKRMSMGREQFTRDILLPYVVWVNLHGSF
jgi:hypothetical protein